MHFATMIPDWNSLDSVRHAHGALEAVALVGFALLVLFEVAAQFTEDKKRERLLEKIGLVFFAIAVLAEIAAYPYGQRNDTLSEKIIGSLDGKARDASNNASDALTKSGEAETKANAATLTASGAVTAAGKAKGEADKLLYLLGPRSILLETNKDAFITALKPFAPQPIRIVVCGDDDNERNSTRDALFELLGNKGAQWAVEKKDASWVECDVRTLSIPMGFGGIVLALSPAQIGQHSATVLAAQKLTDTLNRISITKVQLWESGSILR